LLVDDDEVMRQYLRRVLQQEPALEIFEASDGQEAWEMLQRGPLPNLCLLDIMMPRMNGLELLEKMRSEVRFQQVKVIMCSVVREPNRVQQAITLDVSDYILKPFKNVTLVNMVRRALGVSGPALGAPPRVPHPAAVIPESFPQRLNSFMIESGQALKEIESLIGQDHRPTVLERIAHLKADCRSLGLATLEQAWSALEFALMDRDKREIQARLQTLQALHQGVAEVLGRLSAHLEHEVEIAVF